MTKFGQIPLRVILGKAVKLKMVQCRIASQSTSYTRPPSDNPVFKTPDVNSYSDNYVFKTPAES